MAREVILMTAIAGEAIGCHCTDAEGLAIV
jgi:hypothetical protein